jgi:hypothetical protein
VRVSKKYVQRLLGYPVRFCSERTLFSGLKDPKTLGPKKTQRLWSKNTFKTKKINTDTVRFYSERTLRCADFDFEGNDAS